MNKLIGWGSFAMLIGSLLLFGILWNAAAKIPSGFYESPHVRIESAAGLGSGVHVGDGYVITAAHVVGKDTALKVFADNERLVDKTAEVLWTNTKYDISLVRVHDASKVKSAPLSCAKNFTGQTVTVYGNPMGVHAVYTKGEVTGAVREWATWSKVVPISGPIIYGQSGGGMLDSEGNVVGITVGLLMTQAGIAAFGWAVPAQVVCGLMGRV